MAAILAKQPLLVQGGVLFLPEVHGIFFRYLLPYLVTVLFFTVVYKVIPSGKVSLKSALIGSAIFSALMEIAKQFFTWYVANYTRYNVIFGSLEAVVILVIWVFYVALILLFCAELISSYQRRDMILLEKALLKPRKDRMQIDERLFRKFGRLYGPDEYIFREGDIGQNIFYILSGRVRMEKSAGQAKKVLAEMGPGEYFGEMAALIHAPRTASARSLEESHIAVINGDTLRSLLQGKRRRFPVHAQGVLQPDPAHERGAGGADPVLGPADGDPLFPPGVAALGGSESRSTELAKATGKETAEIHEVLAELGRRGVLTFDGRPRDRLQPGGGPAAGR